MSLALLVYLIGLLPNLEVLLVLLIFACFGGVFVAVMIYAMSHNDYRGTPPTVVITRGWGIFWVSVGLFLVFCKAAVPSEKTAYLMVGAYATQKIYESPEVQQVQTKVFSIINDKLDEYKKQDEKEKEQKK